MRFALSLSRTAVAGLAVLILATAPLAVAQDVPPGSNRKTETPPSAAPDTTSRGPRPGDMQKVFVLRYVDAGPLAKILSVFPAAISFAKVRDLQTLAVSANPAVLAAIEETIKRLDTPPEVKRNVEVTIQVLECSPRPDEANTTPGELQEIVGQLKRTFNYAGCGLAQTLLAAGRDGSGFRAASGILHYDLHARVEIVTSDRVPLVRLTQFQVNHSIPVKVSGGGTSMGNNSFDGDLEVRSGQRAVVGKLGSSESGKDEILVVTAKILD